MCKENIKNITIYEIMKEMEFIKKAIVDRKIYVRERIDILDEKIKFIKMELNKENENIIKLSSLWDEREELCQERKALLLEKKLFKKLDFNNELSYNMLGYKIKGYIDMLENLGLNEDGSEVENLNFAN